MSCKIFLTNARGHYTPGSEVKGTVECNFSESTTLKSVKIRLKCKEHIGWQVGKTHFRKDNVLLWQEQVLLMSDSSMEQTGIQVFLFSFILPLVLPSSFRSDFGFVEYNLKATIEVPLWMNPAYALTLLVHSPISFNTSASDYPQQMVQCMEKQSGFCCFNNEKISMSVELPTTAFVLGEKVNFRVNVQNLTRSNVDFLKIDVVQKIIYGPPHVSNCTREVKGQILTFTDSGVGAHGERSYDLWFIVPELNPILNFNGGTLIIVNYYLKASCKLSFNCKKFFIKIPITIGYSKCDIRALENLGNVVHLSSPFNYVLLFSPSLQNCVN